mmetsp:Transcript_66573/g.150308  ORF Transcript_66573/g.150308 Transcript_66573/m.150308 type:complete len:532 (-) Transcript_66573:733-2328(-)
MGLIAGAHRRDFKRTPDVFPVGERVGKGRLGQVVQVRRVELEGHAEIALLRAVLDEGLEDEADSLRDQSSGDLLRAVHHLAVRVYLLGVLLIKRCAFEELRQGGGVPTDRGWLEEVAALEVCGRGLGEGHLGEARQGRVQVQQRDEVARRKARVRVRLPEARGQAQTERHAHLHVVEVVLAEVTVFAEGESMVRSCDDDGVVPPDVLLGRFQDSPHGVVGVRHGGHVDAAELLHLALLLEARAVAAAGGEVVEPVRRLAAHRGGARLGQVARGQRGRHPHARLDARSHARVAPPGVGVDLPHKVGLVEPDAQEEGAAALVQGRHHSGGVLSDEVVSNGRAPFPGAGAPEMVVARAVRQSVDARVVVQPVLIHESKPVENLSHGCSDPARVSERLGDCLGVGEAWRQGGPITQGVRNGARRGRAHAKHESRPRRTAHWPRRVGVVEVVVGACLVAQPLAGHEAFEVRRVRHEGPVEPQVVHHQEQHVGRRGVADARGGRLPRLSRGPKVGALRAGHDLHRLGQDGREGEHRT